MPRTADIILRFGLAFSFLYPPINAFWDPYSWVGYLPLFAQGYVPDLVLLHAFGILEIVIALWLISGKYVFIPSVAACGILLLIVVMNLPQFPILFRDLSIGTIALTLVITHYPTRKSTAATTDPG